MAFIKKVIGPDEKLIGITMAHWIYAAQGLFWMAGLMILGTFVTNAVNWLFINYVDNRAIIGLQIIANYFFWFCTALGTLLFLLYFIKMVTTEIGLTSKRIIFKKGWLFVDVKEVDLEEIKAAEVNNGLLGRFLNYGYVNCDARFVTNMTLPAVGDPYRFVKALNEARHLLKQNSGTMNVVLEGQADTPQKVDIKTREGGRDIPQAHIEMPEVPAHKLSEKRYESVEEGSVQAVREVMQETAENISRQTEQAAELQPVIFPRDSKQRKEYLRKKIKSVFSYKTRRKAS